MYCLSWPSLQVQLFIHWCSSLNSCIFCWHLFNLTCHHRAEYPLLPQIWQIHLMLCALPKDLLGFLHAVSVIRNLQCSAVLASTLLWTWKVVASGTIAKFMALICLSILSLMACDLCIVQIQCCTGTYRNNCTAKHLPMLLSQFENSVFPLHSNFCLHNW